MQGHKKVNLNRDKCYLLWLNHGAKNRMLYGIIQCIQYRIKATKTYDTWHKMRTIFWERVLNWLLHVRILLLQSPRPRFAQENGLLRRSLLFMQNCSPQELWVFCLCLFRPRFSLKHCPQTSHLYGFSFEWVLRCWVRPLSMVKVLPQMSHPYGFSPEWILKCLDRLGFILKPLLQTGQTNGFSPVCVLSW